MTVINTNVKSLISQNALQRNNRDLSQAMEQLSTGKRINSAADDAAGLAISSRMTAQIRGLDQAIRNANDSISMLQTTEGAMIEMSNMLQRMRELAVQSANDTYTKDDRDYLDLEFQQLKTETNRITRDTQWNGMDILNGTFINDAGAIGKFRFQIGGSAGQVITHTIGPMGFKESTGAVAVDGTAKTLTLSDTFTAGDKISVTVNSEVLTYTITGNDLISGDPASYRTLIASNMAEQFALDTGTTVTASAGVITFASAPSSPSISFVNNNGALTNIKPLDVKTNTNSNTVVSELDIAINRINQERAGIGAVINRLTYAGDNLANVSQNTTESRSRILDADYAKASSELARTQIIQQAATAVLAQANMDQQSVLKLLQG